MSFHRDQFRDLIERVLVDLGYYSPASTSLMLGTAAQESRFGYFLRQNGGGPALGVFQMEPDTEFDIWENYLKSRPVIKNRIYKICNVTGPDPDALEWNLAYQIIMCRLHYRRVRERLPHQNDIEAMARYWKKYYNTPLGKGQTTEFINAYNRFCV